MIVQQTERIPDETVELFSRYGVATIYEGNGRRGAMDSRIKPVCAEMKCCGRALTVKCQPGDNLTLLKAMDIAREGDVIVCDCGGLTELGYWGDLMSTQAKYGKVAGVVLNGGVRDVEELEAIGLPIFSASICVKGVNKYIFGAINMPVCVGGIVVNPGDLIRGDRDGVTVVHLEELNAAMAGTVAREEREDEIRRRIVRGERMFQMMNFGDHLPAEFRDGEE